MVIHYREKVIVSAYSFAEILLMVKACLAFGGSPAPLSFPNIFSVSWLAQKCLPHSTSCFAC